MNDKYNDIIDLPHHTSEKRPRMPISDRAAQFAPFSALTGYDDLVRETARLTDEKIVLDETEKYILNEKLQLLLDNAEREPAANVTYFVKDQKKQGGRYECITGVIKRIDAIERQVIFEDRSKVFIDDIIEIDSDAFGDVYS